jgi:hypothetical protein
VQRYWPYDGSTFEFLTGENEVVDQIILPEIADLLPERLFKYRARYTSSTSAPWSVSKPEYGKEARTLAEALKGELAITDSGWEGWTLIQRFEARAISRSGDKVSLTLRAGSAGASIDRIYLSQADPAAGSEPFDSVDYRATMQDTAFGPPLVIPPAPLNQTNTLTMPAILYTLDHTKPLLIAIDFSATPVSEIMYRDVPPNVANAYYKEQAPLQPGEEPEARKTDRDGYTPWPGPSSRLLKGSMSDSSELDEGHRRFPPPWTVEPIQVKDANGQSLAYVYGRETQADADIAHVLTMDEARRVASNIAKLPNYLAANPEAHD